MVGPGLTDASVAELLRRNGRLPLAEALAIGAQLADRLRDLHADGSVSGVLQPGAVIVGRDGTVSIGGDDSTLGAYSAPEVSAGATASPPADVYSLGLIIQEMLTGTLAAGTLRPDAPTALALLIVNCTGRDPDRRPFAADVAVELHATLERLAGGGVPESPVVAKTLGRVVIAPEIEPPRPWSEQAARDSNVAPQWDQGPPVGTLRTGRRNAGIIRVIALVALAGAGFAAWRLWDLATSPPTPAVTVTVSASSTAAPATTPSSTTASTSSASTVAERQIKPLPIDGVSTFDPSGDARENDDQIALVRDGSADTYWQTELYTGTADLGYKEGVGVVIDLLGARKVTYVELQTPKPGFDVTIYTTLDRVSPTALAGWKPASTLQTISSTKQRVKLPRVPRSRYVLVWITTLTTAIEDSSAYSATIAEIRVVG